MKTRVEIGRDIANKPLYKWACGRNTKEMHRSIAILHIEHGLLNQYMPSLPKPHDEPKKKGITFKAYAEKWLELYKAPKLKPTTLRGYRSTLDTHFLPAFGKRCMIPSLRMIYRSSLTIEKNLHEKRCIQN